MATKYTYSGRGQITATVSALVDITGEGISYYNFLWIAFQDSPGNCYIYKIDPSDPEVVIDQFSVSVTKITRLRRGERGDGTSYDTILFTCDDSVYLGGEIGTNNPGNIEWVPKPSGIEENAIDVARKWDYFYFLTPGIESGENAKVIIFEAGNTEPNATLDLSESGQIVYNASSFFLYNDGVDPDINIAIFTNSSPSYFIDIDTTWDWENYPYAVTYSYSKTEILFSGIDTDYCKKVEVNEELNNIFYIVTKNTPSAIICGSISGMALSLDSVYTLNVSSVDINNAEDLSLSGNYINIACENGTIVRTSNSDPSIHSSIDLSDSDELLTVSSNTDYLLGASTNNSVSELYLIDLYTRKTIQTDLRCKLSKIIETDLRLGYKKVLDTDLRAFYWQNARNYILNTDLRLGYGKVLDTDLRVKLNSLNFINTDFRYVKSDERTTIDNTFVAESGQTSFTLSSPIVTINTVQIGANPPTTNFTIDSTTNIVTISDPIVEGDEIVVNFKTVVETPKSQEDFRITISGVACTDVDLNSISANISLDSVPYFKFTLARKHDNLNYKIDGTYQQITNKNATILYFNNIVLLSGKITKIEASSSEEKVVVTVEATYNQQYFRERTSSTVNVPTISFQSSTPVGSSSSVTTNSYIGPVVATETSNTPITISGKTTISYNPVTVIYSGNYKYTIPMQITGKRLSIYDALLADIEINNPLSVSEQWKSEDITNPNNSSSIKQSNKFIGLYALLGKYQIDRYRKGCDILTSYAELSSYPFNPTYEHFYVVSGSRYNAYATSIGGINYPANSIAYFNDLYVGTDISVLTETICNFTKIKIYYQRKETENGNLINGYLDSLGNNFNNTYRLYPFYIGTSHFGDNNFDERSLTRKDGDYEYKNSFVDPSLSVITNYQEVVFPYSGVYETEEKYEDKERGLYLVTDEQYNYAPYCRKYFDAYYKEQVQEQYGTNPDDLSGDLIPKKTTNANIELTLDAFLYYGINLNEDIRLTNTVAINTYLNQNGFPVYVKGISIDSSKMTATLQCDNELTSLNTNKNPAVDISNGDPINQATNSQYFDYLAKEAVKPSIEKLLFKKYSLKTLQPYE